MNEQQRFLKLLDALEIPREAYWRLRFKQVGVPKDTIEAILKGARHANSDPFEFVESLKEDET